MATEPDNALDLVLRELAFLLQPVLVAARGPMQRQVLFDALGWDLDAITGLPVGDIDEALSDLIPLITALSNGLDVSDFGAILDALQHAGDTIATIDEIDAALRAGLPAIPAGALAVDLLNFLVLRYLHDRFPAVYAALHVATLIDEPKVARAELVDPGTQQAAYDGHARAALRLDRFPRLLTAPDKLFKEVYWPDGFDSQAHADAAADRLFPRLAALVVAFGGDATYGLNPATGLSFGPGGDPLVAHMLTVRQPLPSIITKDGAVVEESVAVTLGIVGPDAADNRAGVVVLPSADAEFRGVTGTWVVDVAATVAPGAFLITKDGVFPDLAGAEVDAALTVTKLPGAAGAALLIGSREGTHFAIGTIVLDSAVQITKDGWTPALGFDLRDAELVLKAGDGDGFLKMVLPPDGMRMPLKFGMSWSPKTGVVFHGGATLEVDLPIDLDLVIVRIPVIHLSVGVDLPQGQPPTLALGVAATAELEIGPVYAVVERMGVQFRFTFPENGGNLGPLDMTLGFKPPKGIGASVDAGPVSGGGYLYLDFDKGEYGGVLHLEIAGKLSVTAIGLLNTRFPDGSEGFSLVVIISAEFPPINLGYGFFLAGLGGMVGINRSMDVPVLRDGIRRGVVGSLLFPVDPIPRARQIVADVGAIFPPTRDQFVVGPMVKFGWGQGLVTATLAIIVQFPALKIALLGRLQLQVPPIDEAAIVVLRLDFAGIVDIPGKELSFDGSLDGSRVRRLLDHGRHRGARGMGRAAELRDVGRRLVPRLRQDPPGVPRAAPPGALARDERQPAAPAGGVLRAHAGDAAVRRPRRVLLLDRHRDRRPARDRRGGELRRAARVPVELRRALQRPRPLAPQSRAVRGRRSSTCGSRARSRSSSTARRRCTGVGRTSSRSTRTSRASRRSSRSTRSTSSRRCASRSATRATGPPSCLPAPPASGCATPPTPRPERCARTAGTLAVHQTVAPLGVTLQKVATPRSAAPRSSSSRAHGRPEVVREG